MYKLSICFGQNKKLRVAVPDTIVLTYYIVLRNTSCIYRWSEFEVNGAMHLT